MDTSLESLTNQDLECGSENGKMKWKGNPQESAQALE